MRVGRGGNSHQGHRAYPFSQQAPGTQTACWKLTVEYMEYVSETAGETWFFTVAFEKMHCRCKSTPWTGDVEQVHAHPYPAAGHTGTCRQSHRGIGTEPQLGGTPQCREELWHSGPGYCPLKGLLTRVALGGGQGTWISGGFL